MGVILSINIILTPFSPKTPLRPFPPSNSSHYWAILILLMQKHHLSHFLGHLCRLSTKGGSIWRHPCPFYNIYWWGFIYLWLLKIYVFGCAYFSCIPNLCLGCYVWFWKTCANNAICFETPCRCICRAFGTLWKSKTEFHPNFHEDCVKNWKLCFGLW